MNYEIIVRSVAKIRIMRALRVGGLFLLDNKARKEAVASFLVWSHKGLNLGPPDYESGATNQLSYETNICIINSSCLSIVLLPPRTLR